jgi:RNA polymerase sigma-70 factor, ECF subfamily
LPSDKPVALEQLTDEDLAARIAGGESRALEALYDRHASQVLGLALKIMGDRAAAEDVLQETFWRAWKLSASYQAERGNVRAWLFRIARNLAIDAYRRRNKRPPPITDVDKDDSLLDQVPDPGTGPAGQSLFRLQQEQITQALASLPPQQRQVIEMAYFHGMTRQQIAEATGEAPGTIHTRARLALQKLRQSLGQEEFED